MREIVASHATPAVRPIRGPAEHETLPVAACMSTNPGAPGSPGLCGAATHDRPSAVPCRLVTSPDPSPSVRPVAYKGEPLDAERGPGLGCFRFQLVLLGVFIVLTPLTVAWGWPNVVSAALLFATLILLLFAGQTVIFLLRLVAADRREGRRRPLGSTTPTVGELEDAARTPAEAVPDAPAEVVPTLRHVPVAPPAAGSPPDPGVRE